MLLLSIRPRFVNSILAGQKTFELRRRQPRLNVKEALVYATSPRMEFVARFRIAKVTHAPLKTLWQLVGDAACVSRSEFDAYYSGLDFGTAIHISDVIELHRPVTLDQVRAVIQDFHPPQSFRYLSNEDLQKFGLIEVRRAA